MPKEMKRFTAKEIQTLSGYKFPGPAAISIAGINPDEIPRNIKHLYSMLIWRAIKAGNGEWTSRDGLTSTESLEDLASCLCWNRGDMAAVLFDLERNGWIAMKERPDGMYTIYIGYPKEAK